MDKKRLTLETIIAFVATDKEGNEGIMGVTVEKVWMPLLCVKEEQIKGMFVIADRLSKKSGFPFRILQFSTRRDITQEIKRVIDGLEL